MKWSAKVVVSLMLCGIAVTASLDAYAADVTPAQRAYTRRAGPCPAGETELPCSAVNKGPTGKEPTGGPNPPPDKTPGQPK